MPLKKQLIKLAIAHPDLREHLLPLLNIHTASNVEPSKHPIVVDVMKELQKSMDFIEREGISRKMRFDTHYAPRDNLFMAYGSFQIPRKDVGSRVIQDTVIRLQQEASNRLRNFNKYIKDWDVEVSRQNSLNLFVKFNLDALELNESSKSSPGQSKGGLPVPVDVKEGLPVYLRKDFMKFSNVSVHGESQELGTPDRSLLKSFEKQEKAYYLEFKKLLHKDLATKGGKFHRQLEDILGTEISSGDFYAVSGEKNGHQFFSDDLFQGRSYAFDEVRFDVLYPHKIRKGFKPKNNPKINKLQQDMLNYYKKEGKWAMGLNKELSKGFFKIGPNSHMQFNGEVTMIIPWNGAYLID